MNRGVSRREFLRVSATAPLALASVQLQAATKAKTDTAIGLYLDGGISSIDFADFKPNAPKEIRGETGKANHGESGVIFSPYFPRLASLSSRLAVIRTMVARSLIHTTGADNALNEKEKTLSLRLGEVHQGGIPYVFMDHPQADKTSIFQTPHKIGDSFLVTWDGKDFTPPAMPKPERLTERRDLLKTIDSLQTDPKVLQRWAEQRALAYDLLGESLPEFTLPPKEVERYGDNAFGKFCLLARRLATAGKARSITMRTIDWDMHSRIHKQMETPARQMDQAVACLIEDMRRGLWRGVLWMRGEFGRTPNLNQDAGRDHWSTHSAVLSGQRIIPGIFGDTDNMLRPKGATVSDHDFSEMVLEAQGQPPDFANGAVGRIVKRDAR